MRAKKSLGQHFLRSSSAIAAIIDASKLTAGERVLEIGPGEGVLTQALLSTGAHVTAVEKDNDLIPVLSETFSKEMSAGTFSLIHADILALNITETIQSPFKLVANIPYYITGQIIRLFLESDHQPSDMVLLVQKEVAERIIARDGKESLLSLSIKAYGEPRLVKVVPRGSFAPAPDVDSAIIAVTGISKKLFTTSSERAFFDIIHAGFAHKRKQLLANLSSIYEKGALGDAFDACGLDRQVRAEDVPLHTWFRLLSELN